MLDGFKDMDAAGWLQWLAGTFYETGYCGDHAVYTSKITKAQHQSLWEFVNAQKTEEMEQCQSASE